MKDAVDAREVGLVYKCHTSQNDKIYDDQHYIDIYTLIHIFVPILVLNICGANFSFHVPVCLVQYRFFVREGNKTLMILGYKSNFRCIYPTKIIFNFFLFRKSNRQLRYSFCREYRLKYDIASLSLR